MINKRPQKHGLYNPANEHDACGVGFVAHLHGKTSRQIIDSGLQLLANLTHRGAVGANPTTGDGAGLMTQMPHNFFRTVAAQNGFSLPNQYGCAMLFLPKQEKQQAAMRQMIDNILAQENLPLLGWRQVPVCREAINDEVAASEPSIWQVFVGGAPHDDEDNNGDGYERRMFIARKQMENAARAAKLDFYCCSFSARTVVYKGMFLADQL
ncbi:MAG: glutamate synthase subunit alpha, partial [Gammaproteobacteria bacterium]